jgi:hypothetical protein
MKKSEELAALCAAVDELAAAMKAKLRRKAREGYRGGLDESNHNMVRSKLHGHYERLVGHHYMRTDDIPPGRATRAPDYQQAVDVANLVMMLWAQAGKPR